MQALELKVPPPIIFVLSIFLTYLCSRYLPYMPFPTSTSLFHWPLIALAVTIGLAGIWEFRKFGTTIDPTKPEKSTSLVSSGIFRVTRNPMYLSMLLIVIAMMLKLGSASGFVGVIFFALYITYFQIKPEEVVIEGIFGKDYVTYKSKVRRWI